MHEAHFDIVFMHFIYVTYFLKGFNLLTVFDVMCIILQQSQWLTFYFMYIIEHIKNNYSNLWFLCNSLQPQ